MYKRQLEESGFSEAKEYGWRADRIYLSGQNTGDAVVAPWMVTQAAHFGIPAPVGQLTRFLYDDIGSTAANGGYIFYEGGTSTPNSGAVIRGNWQQIRDADWLEVGRRDEDGWPCVEWDDLTTDDYIVYEPSSSQWVSFDITSVHTVTNGWRFGITRHRVSNGDGANVPITDGNTVTFFLSVPRRPSCQTPVSYTHLTLPTKA